MARFDTAARTHVGLRRKLNEDGILSCPGRGYWAVADGMGGHDAGEVASARALDALRTLPTSYRLDDLMDAIRTALMRANRDLIALAGGGEERVIGSTLAGVAIARDEARCFWVGDSRVYRRRGGNIDQISHDHSLVQQLVDGGLIAAEEAESHPNANVITRAIGVSDKFAVDTVSVEVRSGDRFLLATDGLTRLATAGELARMAGMSSIEEACDAMLALALERGAPDNVSLILVEVG
ncbi:protein phosphatase 2C domain-containing protein [Sphingomonas sp. ASV193]|uniref:PP2C family protein-serine/threonine phosphatase n=1 Tax=Sphingomonas sp. ASV193 TaxID=3144405 RepID=UPI0032E8B508